MATCSGEITAWASGIVDNIGDTGLSVARVFSWLNNNLYKLNLAIDTCFYVNSSGCITPDMSPAQSGLFQGIYYCEYLSKKVVENLGAAAYQWTSIQGEKQGTIKRVSVTDIAKTYRLEAADCRANLEELIAWYNNQNWGCLPTQITYAQRGHISQESLMPLCGSYFDFSNLYPSSESCSDGCSGETFNFLTDEA